ncbi:MAG: class I SAM-dependent methyltransferase [Candidatus Micrarchaeia archaeon]
MKFAKVNKSRAEELKRILKKYNAVNNKYLIDHDADYVYFPLKNELPDVAKGIAEVVEAKGHKNIKRGDSFKEKLAAILPQEKITSITNGYDIYGNIGVLDIEDDVILYEKEIAKALMESDKRITTVLKKDGAVYGDYRLRNFKYIAGKKSFNTTIKENDCVFRLDIRKAFFSNRLAFERNRISRLAVHDKNIAVMFAGVGPFAIEIAKRNKNANIIAIELNKDAYNYMKKNIKENKTYNVKPILGDVKEVAKKYSCFADRIVMPLPKSSINFLDEAYKVARNGCIVHLYVFGNINTAYKDIVENIKQNAKKNKYKVEFIFQRTVRPYSPSEIEICVDYKITKKCNGESQAKQGQ